MEEEEGGGAIYCRDLVGGMCRYLRFALAPLPFSFFWSFYWYSAAWFDCWVGISYGVIRGDDIWMGGVMTCVEFLLKHFVLRHGVVSFLSAFFSSVVKVIKKKGGV